MGLDEIREIVDYAGTVERLVGICFVAFQYFRFVFFARRQLMLVWCILESLAHFIELFQSDALNGG